MAKRIRGDRISKMGDDHRNGGCGDPDGSHLWTGKQGRACLFPAAVPSLYQCPEASARWCTDGLQHRKGKAGNPAENPLRNPEWHGGGREGGGGEIWRVQNAGWRRVFCDGALPAPGLQARVESGGAVMGLPVPWVQI